MFSVSSVHLERADLVAAWCPCLFSQVAMFAIDHRIPEGFGLQGTLKLSCSTPCHGHGHLPQAPPNLTLNWTSEGPIPGEGPDVKCYKTQLRFRAKTVALVLGTKRWDGFGTVKGYSERGKGVEL